LSAKADVPPAWKSNAFEAAAAAVQVMFCLNAVAAPEVFQVGRNWTMLSVWEPLKLSLTVKGTAVDPLRVETFINTSLVPVEAELSPMVNSV
jgi:hypothetical protein